MTYSKLIGRTSLMTDSKTVAEQLSRKLNQAGFDAQLYNAAPAEEYTITVPQTQAQQARRFLDDYFDQQEHKEDSINQWRSSLLTPSPHFIRAEDKFKDKSSSGYIFLGAGIYTICWSIRLCLKDKAFNSYLIFSIIAGILFLIFGLNTLVRSREIKKNIKEENDFTNRVVSWGVSTYSSDQIDKMVTSVYEDPSPEELYYYRHDLLKDYILRAYSIDNALYLDYLTDEIYNILYQTESQ